LEIGGLKFLSSDLEPGDFFGERSLLTGASGSATVTCATDLMVGEVTKEAVRQLVDRDPFVAELLSKAVAKRELQNTTMLEEHYADEDEIVEKQAGQILDSLKKFFKLS